MAQSRVSEPKRGKESISRGWGQSVVDRWGLSTESTIVDCLQTVYYNTE